MNINMPDPNPGRCLNHRHRNGESVRCLDYDNVPHICSFPPFPSDVTFSTASQIYSLNTDPKPWVKPHD